MFSLFAWEKQPDGSLDLPGGDGCSPLVVVSETAGFPGRRNAKDTTAMFKFGCFPYNIGFYVNRGLNIIWMLCEREIA